MAYLPQDLILDVLSRLPVKSLLRFKCVSKLWLDLIHSPEFVNFHLHRSKTRTRILETTYLSPDVFFDLEFDPNNDCKAVPRNLYGPDADSLTVYGTCNGLICLLSKSNFPRLTVFWNPSTRRYRQGPVLIHPFIICGFGYDQENKDHKLLIVTHNYETGTCYKIYSLKSDSWGPEKEQSGLSIFGESSAFHDGFVYFIGVLYERDHNEDNWVVAFDLATEEWREVVALPDPNDVLWLMHGGLSTLGDSLCAISASMEVWVMKSEGSHKSWKKLFHLMGVPLVYAEGGRKVLVFDYQGLEWRDIEKEEVKADPVYVTYEFDEYSHVAHLRVKAAFTYCESLISV